MRRKGDEIDVGVKLKFSILITFVNDRRDTYSMDPRYIIQNHWTKALVGKPFVAKENTDERLAD